MLLVDELDTELLLDIELLDIELLDSELDIDDELLEELLSEELELEEEADGIGVTTGGLVITGTKSPAKSMSDSPTNPVLRSPCDIIGITTDPTGASCVI
tara:strand:- start:5565 stop:5864 length:300 start_codon:yes stop_codon:yes gene_type:complete